jgi:hypothetical protein
MSTTIVRQIMLRRWFPADDPFAACVARMTILREDFAIELMGIYEAEIAPLDGNTSEYRRVYFWRNLVRTAFEISSVLRRLKSLPEFLAALAAQPPERSAQFDTLVREFDLQHALLKSLRNDIGGHVQQAKVEEALNGMPGDKWGFLELGETLNKTHYRFAGELVLEMKITGLPDNKRIPEIERQIRETAKLLPVFALMEAVFATYVEARRLDK